MSEAIAKLPANDGSKIGRVIGVVSGKGGVGKSMLSSLYAVTASRMGYSVGLLDADILGPSIPKIFGVHEKLIGTEDGMMLPAETKTGIKLVSVNLILDNESDPVAWRGPVISGVVRQFWTDVIWGNTDYMFVDMPPGTGDVMLTVLQSLPVDSLIIVASPQELVSVIVEKAVKLAGKMNVPILGLVENMSYITCPHCNKKISLFGKSNMDKLCESYGIKLISRLPVLPELSALSDKGELESADFPFMDELGRALI